MSVNFYDLNQPFEARLKACIRWLKTKGHDEKAVERIAGGFLQNHLTETKETILAHAKEQERLLKAKIAKRKQTF